MADEKAEKGASGPPAAIQRSKLITLPVCQKTVEIRRWSYFRLMQISDFLNEIISGLPEDVEINTREAVSFFFKHGARKILDVARLSLVPEHRDLVDDEIDAKDAFFLIQEAFDLNEAEENLKKATSLAGSFLLGKAAAKANQADGTQKTAAATAAKES